MMMMIAVVLVAVVVRILVVVAEAVAVVMVVILTRCGMSMEGKVSDDNVDDDLVIWSGGLRRLFGDFPALIARHQEWPGDRLSRHESQRFCWKKSS